jgi:hypothetical protein
VLNHKSFIPPFHHSTQLLWCIITLARSRLTLQSTPLLVASQ